MVSHKLGVAIAASTALNACSTIPDSGPGLLPFKGLESTSWQLVEIQSSDDTQPPRSAADPAKYRIDFESGNEASIILDCNRAIGTWRNDIANATGGSLTFGPLAVTKALCPEPTLGELLERQFPDVRSFVIRDGRMHMALMADGGFIVWEPATTPE